MKRLLLPLLAVLALPTAVNAEEFTEIKPKNIYSYKKSSLVKFTNEEERRFIRFEGTTKMPTCLTVSPVSCRPDVIRHMSRKLGNKSFQNPIFNYEIDCDNQTFNREGDNLSWVLLYIDQTAVGVYQKYCPIEEWSKLPNK